MEEKIELMYSSSQLNNFRQELTKSIVQVMDSGQFIMGPEVNEFENNVVEYTKIKHAISCGNGTDALTLALVALNVNRGDLVFVPSFTFAATAEAVALLGAVPYFVDVDEHDFNISPESLESALNDAKQKKLPVKGVITVDLFGNPCNYTEIKNICQKHGIFHLSDIAQSFGAKYKGEHVSNLGDISTTSFFPTKPLGCYGDGGMIFTNNAELAKVARSLRVHGKGEHKYHNVRIGFNSRLDTMQACVLNHKLPHLDGELRARNALAKFYNDSLNGKIKIPKIDDDNWSAWAVYSLLHPKRDEIIAKLAEHGIPSNIYYRTNLHDQPAYNHFPRVKNMYNSDLYVREVFCLPMHAYVTEIQREYIVSKLLQILEEIDGSN